MDLIGAAFALLGVGIYLVGLIWMFVIPFRESAKYGLLTLFMPLYFLYYLVSRWDRMRGPLILIIVGLVAAFLGSMMAGTIPTY